MSSSKSGIIKTHALFCLCRPKGKEIYYSPQHPKDLLTTIQQKRWCLRKYKNIYVKTHYNILHQHLITTAQSTLCNPKLPFVYFRFKASKIKIAYNKCIIIHMESKVRKLQCRGKCRRARIVLPAFPWINKSILSNTCGVVHLLLNNLQGAFRSLRICGKVKHGWLLLPMDKECKVFILFRGLHGLKTEARTRPVPEIVWPNPTRPERHG